MPRSWRYLLPSWFAVTSILFGAFSPALAEGPAEPSATALIEALITRREPVGGSFDLIDHMGRRRTDADFRGKLVVIYFGYTHCPDVCPTELQAISLALDELGMAANRVQPLFITVDPERDTPSVLADYVSSFHARLVALTGPPRRSGEWRSPTRSSSRNPPWQGPMAMRSITPASSIWSARTGAISTSFRRVWRPNGSSRLSGFISIARLARQGVLTLHDSAGELCALFG